MHENILYKTGKRRIGQVFIEYSMNSIKQKSATIIYSKITNNFC